MRARVAKMIFPDEIAAFILSFCAVVRVESGAMIAFRTMVAMRSAALVLRRFVNAAAKQDHTLA